MKRLNAVAIQQGFEITMDEKQMKYVASATMTVRHAADKRRHNIMRHAFFHKIDAGAD